MNRTIFLPLHLQSLPSLLRGRQQKFQLQNKKTKHYNSAHYSTEQNCLAPKSPEQSCAAVFPGNLPTGTRPPTMFRLWLILPPPSWACVVAENKLELEPSRTGCCRCPDPCRSCLAMEGQILMPRMYYPCNSLTGPRWSDVFLMLSFAADQHVWILAALSRINRELRLQNISWEALKKF